MKKLAMSCFIAGGVVTFLGDTWIVAAISVALIATGAVLIRRKV